MKKAIIIIVAIAAVGLIAWKLADNKTEMAEDAKLAEEVSDQIPVEIGQVTNKRLESENAAIGTFEAITDLTMLSQTEGLVIKLYREKGDFVKKGELLAQVENEILQANMASARANYEKAKTDFGRFTKLAQKDAITERQLEDATIAQANSEAQYKTVKKQLEDTYIRATATGFINEDYIQEGSNIARNAKLFDIVDVSKLKLNVKVTASNVLNIKEGDEVSLTTEIYPNESYTGIVTAVAAKADNSLKYDVEILLDNASQEKPLKAGMFGRANFEFTNASDALYISRDALTGSIKDPTVFVVKDGIAQLVKIKIGEVRDTEIEVLSGLSLNDKVVVNGQINLIDGTRVRPINEDAQSLSAEAK